LDLSVSARFFLCDANLKRLSGAKRFHSIGAVLRSRLMRGAAQQAIGPGRQGASAQGALGRAEDGSKK
jgi:hypothetical protein